MTHDKPLFTPGPLTTSRSVKTAMLRDLGSRDDDFIHAVAAIRRDLLALAGVSQASGWEAVLMQGSGTFTIEAAISSLIAPHHRLLIAINGAYGERMLQIARLHGIDAIPHRTPEHTPIDPASITAALDAHNPDWLAVVHCETTTGLLNPVHALGAALAARPTRYLIDGMSAFGAIPVHLDDLHADVYISSSNKCIEGVPGFAFALVRRHLLAASKGLARTVSLDLVAQWERLEHDGQFRFTPPTHALLAFHQALLELTAEGGPAARLARYHDLQSMLVAGMNALGFRTLLDPDHQSPIITTFHQPTDPWFDFQRFYTLLNRKGFVIYPGKLTEALCFRLGTIGQLSHTDVTGLLQAIKASMDEMSAE